MSTRAIIGYKREDGKFVGGWQWNDGKGLCPLLRSQFNTIEKVNELISNGVWNNIITPQDKDTLEHFKEWTERPNTDYYLVEVGKCHLLKEKPDDSASCFEGDTGISSIENGIIIFDSIDDAIGQDINYLYEFIPVSNSWIIHQ